MQRADKQISHVLHMGHFPLIEEGARMSVYRNGNVQVVPPFAPQIHHHLVCDIEQIVHFHGYRFRHIVHRIFPFKIAGRPVYDRFC